MTGDYFFFSAALRYGEISEPGDYSVRLRRVVTELDFEAYEARRAAIRAKYAADYDAYPEDGVYEDEPDPEA